jgi:hypothetical protein
LGRTARARGLGRNLFDIGKESLRPDSGPLFAELLKLLKDSPQLKLTIEGHTTARAIPRSYLTLSQRRAAGVKKYLTDEGIDAARRSTTGWATRSPSGDNGTVDGCAQDQRLALVEGSSMRIGLAVGVLSVGLSASSARAAADQATQDRWNAIPSFDGTFEVSVDDPPISGGEFRSHAHRWVQGSFHLTRTNQDPAFPQWTGTWTGGTVVDVEVLHARAGLMQSRKGGGAATGEVSFGVDFRPGRWSGTYGLVVSGGAGPVCSIFQTGQGARQGPCGEAPGIYVQMQPLPSGTTITGSGTPTSAKNGQYKYTIGGGGPPPGVPVVDGRPCLCDGDPGAFRARVEGHLDGDFLPFETRGGGKVSENRGGKEASLALQGDPKTDPMATIVAVFRKTDGSELRSAPFSVHFARVDRSEPQASAWGGAHNDPAGDSDYRFDDAKTGHIEVDVKGKAWLDGQEVSGKIHWLVGGGLLTAEKSDGETLHLVADGLPSDNGGFGRRTVEGRITKDGCSCQSVPVGVRVFYSLTARNSPNADVPNWAYYWAQTQAGHGFAFEYVDALPTGCIAPAPDDENAQGRFDSCKDKVFLTPLLVSKPCANRPDGSASHFIDCFAEVLRHETQHKNEWHLWWPVVYSVVDDLDADGVPNAVELATPGCNPVLKRSCSGRPDPSLTDIELDAYQVGWAWPVGSDDGEDWAYPGKQWPR